MRKVNFIENFMSDARYALRMLLHSPGFSVTAILALALGIGANTAIFSVVNTVLLQPLPFPEPDRLVELELTSPQGNGDIASVTKYNVWKEQTKAFEAVAAYGGGPGVNLVGGDRPEQLKATRASAEFFQVFRVPLEIGRAYTKEEDIPNGPSSWCCRMDCGETISAATPRSSGRRSNWAMRHTWCPAFWGRRFISTRRRTFIFRCRRIQTAWTNRTTSRRRRG